MNPLAAYVLAAMLAWLPPAQQTEVVLAPVDQKPAAEAAQRARYEAIAIDLAAAVERDDEPAVFENDPDKRKTALLLAAIAFYESSYSARIERNECHVDECDGGAAIGMFQLHMGGGIAFDGVAWKQDPKGLHPKDVLADRVLFARLVLHVIRGWHSSGYAEGKRRRRVLDYVSAHPS